MKNWVMLLICATIIGCQSQPTEPSPAFKKEIEEIEAGMKPPTPVKCELKKEKMALCADGRCKGSFIAEFPRTGKFVLESHLATVSDQFDGGNRYFPNSSTERIESHLAASCSLLNLSIPNSDCSKVYSSKYVRVWTPPENGKAGQGSVGDIKPSVLEEMFTCNMMWSSKTKPKAGEKWLAKFGSKSAVVVMGYETGPGDTKTWAGGCQGEVFYALGASGGAVMTLGRLIDQTLAPGPIVCE